MPIDAGAMFALRAFQMYAVNASRTSPAVRWATPDTRMSIPSIRRANSGGVSGRSVRTGAADSLGARPVSVM